MDSNAAPEDQWLPARLIPTSGIKGAQERERRATSALLSVMIAVPEFARAFLKRTGAPAGKLEAFIETPFESKTKGKIRPDGALIVRRGKKQWRALVEVKTGGNTLDLRQVEGYLDLARDEGFDAVITISNEMNTTVDDHPLPVSKSKTKKVNLYHYSWVSITTEALIQQDFRGVSDPDQAWILSELIAYLENPQSGAMEFDDMGPHWVRIRDGAHAATLRPSDEGVADVVTRWEQFIQYLRLSLSRRLGVKVKQVLSRKESEPVVRKSLLAEQLAAIGDMSGVLRIENAAGDIRLVASLKARTVTATVELDAPGEGRPLTRIRWLLRQLPENQGDLRIESWYKNERYPITRKLSEALENPKSLLSADNSKPPWWFGVSKIGDMGTKRAGTKGSFTAQATELVLDFYRDVVQPLKPWRASAPKLREEETPEIAEERREESMEAAISAPAPPRQA